MFSFFKSCSKWLHIPVKLKGYDDVFTLSIILEKASVAFAHLAISDQFNIQFITPVSILIEMEYNEIDLLLRFHEHNEKEIIFEFSNSNDLEVFISQFNICSKLTTKIESMFAQENANFINTFTQPQTRPTNLTKGTAEIASVLLPIDSPLAEKTWKQRVLESNKPFITEIYGLKFGFLTWNVGEAKVTDEIINPISAIFSGPRMDALFVVLEEINYGTESIVIGSSAAKGEWLRVFRKIMHAVQLDYALIKCESLGGVFSALFVRPEFAEYFSVREPQTLRLGVAGILANKSALIYNIVASEASFFVVGCHLAPHTGHYKERLQQLELILKQIPECDYVVILGDMNFRLMITYEKAVELANEGNIEELLETDQLKAALNFTDLMKGFTEGEIKFAPTYKYDKGTDDFDTGPKHRAPAYTDRVIVRTSPPRIKVGPTDKFIFETDLLRTKINNCFKFETDDNFGTDEFPVNYPSPPTCLTYTYMNARISDHRPVFALFQFPIPIIQRKNYKFLCDLMEKKKKEAKLFSTPIVKYKVVDEYLDIANVGCCWVRWRADAVGATLQNTKGVIFPTMNALTKFTKNSANEPAKITIYVEGLKPHEINI